MWLVTICLSCLSDRMEQFGFYTKKLRLIFIGVFSKSLLQKNYIKILK